MTEKPLPSDSIPSWEDYAAARKAVAAFFSQPTPTREQMLAGKAQRGGADAKYRGRIAEPMSKPLRPQPAIPQWTDNPKLKAARDAFFGAPKPTSEQMRQQVKRNREARPQQPPTDQPMI